MVGAKHAVVLTSGTFIGCDQVPGSIPVDCSIRRRNQIEKLLYARINAHGNTPARSGIGAAARIRNRGEQALMGKRIRHGGNRCGCLYLAKPLIVRKEEGAVMRQGPSESSTELVAHKRRYRGATQIKIVLGIEC